MIDIKDIKTGKYCMINPTAQFYGKPEDFEIGDNVRIDGFCVLSGKIKIGSFVHISPGVYLFGTAGIIIEDYVSLSSRVAVYSVNDDYVDGYMINPMLPENLRKVKSETVTFKKHCVVGSGSTVMPGVIVGEGVAVGAMSYINKSIQPYQVVAGIPAKFLKMRNQFKLKELEKEHLAIREIREINEY